MASVSQAVVVKEPYVGPQPFTEMDETIFFGRSVESQDLFSLIVAHGEVLLYAQSGAGKTSLLNAGVIPLLKRRGLKVLPPTRVSCVIPSGIKISEIKNLYMFSALRGWAPADTPGSVLANQSLSDFLNLPPLDAMADEYPVAASGARTGPPEVLIFDQFEEIFSRYQERRADRDDFFNQVSEALRRGPHLRVVFAMREDY